MIKGRTSTSLSETLTLNGPLYPRLTILTLIHALMLLFLSLLLLILSSPEASSADALDVATTVANFFNDSLFERLDGECFRAGMMQSES